MNNTRRKDLNEMAARITASIDRFNDLLTDLEGIKEDEESAYDNMPEGIQASERGEMAQEAINAMDEAHSKMEELTELLAEIANKLEEAAE